MRLQIIISAAMDSVNLINALMAQDSRDEEEADTVARNVEHLQLMIAKDFGRLKT